MKSVDDVRDALAEHDYLADEGLATAIFLALAPAAAAAARGRGRRRQDRGRQGARPLDRRRAAPPPVLRGHRRRPGRLRVGLLPPAAAPAGGRGRAAARSSRTSSTPSGSSCAARCCGRSTTTGAEPPVLLDRRGRPGRRRVRGVPARDPLRLLGHRARARHVPRRDAADRGRHLEPHPRRARRARSAAACTTGSTTPTSSASSRSCASQAPRGRRGARPPGRRRGGGAARRSSCTSRRASPRRSTGPRRSPRSGVAELDERAVDVDARHRPQVPRGPGARARRTASARSCAGRDRRTASAVTPAATGVDRPSPCRVRPAAAGRRARRAGRQRRHVRRGARRGRARATAIDVYWAGRATLVRRPEDIAVYDRGVRRRSGSARRRCPAPRPIRADRRSSLAFDDRGRRPECRRAASRRPTTDPSCTVRWSPAEVLRHRDFADLHRGRARRGPPADGRPPPRRARCAGRGGAGASHAAAAGPTSAARSARALRTGGEPVRAAVPRPVDRGRAGSCCSAT